MSKLSVKKAVDRVVDTVYRPSDTPTGQAVSDLVQVLVEDNPNVEKNHVIVMLESRGFPAAEKLECFIEAQIKKHKPA